MTDLKLPDADWLRRKVEADPDVDCEAGVPLMPDQKAYVAEIARLQAENEALRFAITGGEDAPGYISSLPLQAILDVAHENHMAHLADIDTVETLLQVVGAFIIAGAYADTFPDDAEDAKDMAFGDSYWRGAAALWAGEDILSRAHEAAKERMGRENPVQVKGFGDDWSAATTGGGVVDG